jgi:hypothetical protein
MRQGCDIELFLRAERSMLVTSLKLKKNKNSNNCMIGTLKINSGKNFNVIHFILKKCFLASFHTFCFFLGKAIIDGYWPKSCACSTKHIGVGLESRERMPQGTRR